MQMHPLFETLLPRIVTAIRSAPSADGTSGAALQQLDWPWLASDHGHATIDNLALVERLPLRPDLPSRAAAASRAALRLAIQDVQTALGDACDEAQEWANNLVYALLSQGLPSCAADLGSFLMQPELSARLRELDAKVRVINCATAHHLMGEHAQAAAVLETVSWHDCWPDFQLAVASLRLDFAHAANLMRSIGRTGRLLRQESYAAWPSLAAFRQSREFADAFRDVFGHADIPTPTVR